MDIQIKNLSVSFPSPQGDAKVLRDADIILKSGKITAIVGESGSGKSILGAAVMGLLEQPVRVSGEILFGDTDLLSLSEKELNDLRERFKKEYARLKGWNPENLNIEQLNEIHSDKRWQSPLLLS